MSESIPHISGPSFVDPSKLKQVEPPMEIRLRVNIYCAQLKPQHLSRDFMRQPNVVAQQNFSYMQTPMGYRYPTQCRFDVFPRARIDNVSTWMNPGPVQNAQRYFFQPRLAMPPIDMFYDNFTIKNEFSEKVVSTMNSINFLEDNHSTDRAFPVQINCGPSEQQSTTKCLIKQQSQDNIRQLLYDYFYEEDVRDHYQVFDTIELNVIKIFLIKKLVHDKKKSRIFFTISNLRPDDLIKFMRLNPPLNRKNIIKSNVFKRVWKLLEKRHEGDFNNYYFGQMSAKLPRDSFSIKSYRKNHCFNLADEFYHRCFLSKKFKEDFFEAIRDPFLKATILKQSKQKFLNSFDFWITEIQNFIKKNVNPFDRAAKLPDFKYGMSHHDLELSICLFEKILIKD